MFEIIIMNAGRVWNIILPLMHQPMQHAWPPTITYHKQQSIYDNNIAPLQTNMMASFSIRKIKKRENEGLSKRSLPERLVVEFSV